MKNSIELSTIPAGSKIRVGAPAERPEGAIDALLKLFAGKENVVSARLGLMEIQYPEGGSEFMYTIGIECSADETSTIQEAIDTISTIREGRWPISIVPPASQYFSSEAIVFYSQNTKRKNFLGRLLRRN